MKEHFQDQGVRKWAGEDLIELQAEPLAALQALVEPYAPCIIKGCEVAEAGDGVYDVAAGLVALRGADKDGNDCVKVVRFDGLTGTALPLRLVLQVSRLVRVYSDNGVKPIAYDYTAEASTGDVGDRPFLEITADGGKRLVDAIGISQKLDREGGEAKAVKVTFNEAAARELPESGNRLGTIVGSVRKWFSDLRALAFKDKVALSDLAADTTEALDSKVDKVTDKGLSSNDFTQALLDKLNGIEPGANNYTHPVFNDIKSTRLYKIGVLGGHVSVATAATKDDITALGIPAQDTTYGDATTLASGLMSAADKIKIDKLTGVLVKVVAAGSVSVSSSGTIGSNNSYKLGNWSVTRQSRGVYIVKLNDFTDARAPVFFPFVLSSTPYATYDTRCEVRSNYPGEFSVHLFKLYENSYITYDGSFYFCVLRLND